MLTPRRLLTLAAAVSTASAAYQGFNYGSTFTDGRPKVQADFEAEFRTAASLAGTNGGFTSARLYTMVQAGTANDPISAIPAAIASRTSLLLGLWASAGDAAFGNELEALRKTIATYGSQLDGLIAGISIGSEDLYRASPIGIAAGEYAGAQPDTLVSYIRQVRSLIAGTPLQGAPLGHVDTWTAYVNGSNAGLIAACDWIGMDAYPYFQNTMPNSIASGRQLFADALGATQGASQGKPVWITETGWPVSGKTVGAGVPSLENAKTFWNEVGCPMFGKTNVWWYTLQDSAPGTPNPSFGVIGSSLTTTPLYDLSCPANPSPPPPPASSPSPNPSTPSSTVPPPTTGGGIGSPGASGQESGSGSGSGGGAPSPTTGSSGTGSSSGANPPTTSSGAGSSSGGSGSSSGSGSGTGTGSGSGTGTGTGTGSGSGSSSGTGSGTGTGTGTTAGAGAGGSRTTTSTSTTPTGGAARPTFAAMGIAAAIALAVL